MKNTHIHILSLGYLGSIFLIVWHATSLSSGHCDYVGLGTLAGGMAAGIGALAWGHTKS